MLHEEGIQTLMPAEPWMSDENDTRRASDHETGQGSPSAEVQSFLRALEPVLTEAIRRAGQDPSLRQALRQAGRMLTAAADTASDTAEAKAAPASKSPTRAAQPAPAATSVSAPTTMRTLQIGSETVQVPVREHTPGRTTIGNPRVISSRPTRTPRTQHAVAHTPAAQEQPAPQGPDSEDAGPPDLSVVTTRASLMAECCRWAITRRRRLDQGADMDTDIRPHDRALKERGEQLPTWYAWPLDAYVQLPDDATLEDIAGCYENLALIAEYTAKVVEQTDSDDARQDAYEMLAECQSALRKALTDADVIRGPDRDQDDAFHWLKIRTFEDRIFIPRYMKKDDTADPVVWAERRERIESMRSTRERQHAREREYAQLINRVRYCCRKITEGDPDELTHQWARLDESIAALVPDHIRHSDPDLRELILPVIEQMPDDFEPGPEFQQVLRAADHYLATRESNENQSESTRKPDQSPHVQQVADMLHDRVVIIIGGEERRHAKAALERAFGLRELRWIATDPHESLSTFESDVARPEVDLVMLAIRWASHSYAGIDDQCRRHGKPFVRLPAGYNPNRVADEILKQVSDQLMQN